MMAASESGHPAIDAELQIDQVQTADGTTATVVARCIRGPIRVGARFHRVREALEPMHLELTRILTPGRPAFELGPVHTALVTLRGTGTPYLRSGNLACAHPGPLDVDDDIAGGGDRLADHSAQQLSRMTPVPGKRIHDFDIPRDLGGA